MENIEVFVSENFQFLEMKFSIYWYRSVFDANTMFNEDEQILKGMTLESNEQTPKLKVAHMSFSRVKLACFG